MEKRVLTQKSEYKQRILVTSNKNQLGDKIMGEGAYRQMREEYPEAYCIGMQYYPPSRVGPLPIETMLAGLDEVWTFKKEDDIVALLIEEKIDIVFNIFKSVIKGKPNRDAWQGEEIYALNKYRSYKSRFYVPEVTAQWAKTKLDRIIPRSAKKAMIVGMHARHLQRKVYVNMSLSWFSQLVEGIQRKYDPFVIIFGHGDNRPLYEGARLFDTLPLGLTIFEVAALLSNCDFYVGGDTGVTCLAGALNIPLIGVNWCETPLNWPGRMYAVSPNRYICLPSGETYKPRDADLVDLGVELPLTKTEQREIVRHNIVFQRSTQLSKVFNAIEQVLEHKDGGADFIHPTKIPEALAPQDNAGAHKKRGIAHYKARQYQLALEEFAIATRLDPKYAEGFYLQGCTCYMMRNYAEALEKWEVTLQLNPSHKYAKEWLNNVKRIMQGD